MGSRVPRWPIFRIPKARRARRTTSKEDALGFIYERMPDNIGPSKVISFIPLPGGRIERILFTSYLPSRGRKN
jgi:hypothetical protein